MTTGSSIDVLIPVFNAEATLDESFASLAAQSFGDFRVIAIDDGSTDASAALLERWAQTDRRFTFVSTPNRGIVAALNHGLEAASAPIIARLDADDICDARRFERQHAYLMEHADCVGVGGRVEHIDETGAAIGGMPHPGDPGQADAWRIPAREPYIVHPFLMARTSALRQAGGYRHVPHSEDSDLFWRLSEFGDLHNLDEIVGRYRFHTGSISGASVVSGRVMAFGSQLGAWAARQRARGLTDTGFGQDLVKRLTGARTLAAMGEIVEPIVGKDANQVWLATGIKLLELAAYRPYEIETSDADFISGAVRGARRIELRPGNRGEIRWHLSQTAARLLRSGRFETARRLIPPALWPVALARAATS